MYSPLDSDKIKHLSHLFGKALLATIRKGKTVDRFILIGVTQIQLLKAFFM